MSNFICPTCGFTNIDCGKDGYKTRREIDFEQEITRLTDLNKQYSYLIKQRDIHNKELEKKLEIAVKTLEDINFQLSIYLEEPNAEINFANSRLWQFDKLIKQALKEIEG